MGIKSWVQALADLGSRYGTALQQAWQHRAHTDTPTRLPHEVEFLPAALALQETPISPLPRLSMWMMMAFALLAFLWAVFGRIDVVATAQGKVVPNDRIKTIQPFETATVQAIYVSDGQNVKAGDVLIELDATTPNADKDRFQNDLLSARLQVARARALLSALETGKRPQWVQSLKGIKGAKGIEELEGVDSVRFQEAKHLLMGQYEEYASKLANINAEMFKKEAERRSTLELVRKLEHTVPLVQQRAKDFKEMADERLIAPHEFMEREQIRLEQEGDLSTQRSRVKEIEAGLQEMKGQRASLMAETRRINLDSINDGLQKAATLEQELVKARSHSELMKLVAPVSGTVQQLAVHTVGGVVTPAQPLMIIVPQDNSVEIEAFVENKDIGFVKKGQDAEVKIETFQYTKYGMIHAHIASVSHDAINDEKRGLIYSARVNMQRSTLNVEGTEVSLSPGMAVTVEIKTGKRRLIEYFLSPLIAYGHESLQER
ncbi:MAG: HlyD family type I secretion periplasmic adaptor subunit [Pseudomonadota bacterium]